MSAKEIRLTDNEWEIYECLWENAPLTLAQISRRFAERTGLTRSTAETMVARMEKKGLFRVEYGQKAKLFYPVYAREDAVKRATRSFLERVYGGKPGLLMSSMAESGDFSDDEIDELYRIIKEARAKRDE
jgi:BlaI family penicillinase repressor